MQQLLAAISLRQIKTNANAVRNFSRLPLIAVVKDDAYGHGAEYVAAALCGIAEMFAVATVEEGAALAPCGADTLVLTPPISSDDALRTVAYGMIGSVNSLTSLRLFARAGEVLGKAPRVHICVNTGMNRYGVRPERAGYTAREAAKLGVSAEGVYSHFFLPSCKEAALRQRELFFRACGQVKESFPHAVCHLAATGGLEYAEGTDAVRVGLALYGYLPAHLKGKLPVRPALKLYARVAQSGTFLGGGVGYAAAERPYRALHTLRAGYGDGLFRTEPSGAIGALCMDACVREGEAPVGALCRIVPDLESYAAAHGTCVYEALVRIAPKAERRYV